MANLPGNQVLLAATQISANGQGASLDGLGAHKSLWIDLNLSAVPSGGAPTLDLYLQSSADGGTTWRDHAHFQFTTSALHKFWQISGEAAGSAASLAASDAALAGDTVVQGPWGDRLRLKWVFAAGGSSGSYMLGAFLVGKAR
jgi:hypothetical protein